MGCQTSMAKMAELQTKSKKQMHFDKCHIPAKNSSRHIANSKRKSFAETMDSAKMSPSNLGLESVIGIEDRWVARKPTQNEMALLKLKIND